MEITTFTLQEPDNDGDMLCSLAVSFQNDSEHEIRLARTSVVLYNKDGVACAGNIDSDEDLRLESGEEFELSVGMPWASTIFFGDKRDDVTCHVTSTLYRREFFRLGELDIKPKAKALQFLSKSITSDALAPKIDVVFKLGEPDGDGDIRIEGRCGLRNLLDERLDKVTLKTELVDEDDTVLESDSTDVALNPMGENMVEFAWWAVKKSLLKKARLRCSLAVFRRAAVLSCEGTSSPA